MSTIKYQVIGGKKINGKIACMGAKNFATKAMLASLLASDSTVINNVPKIGDVEITQQLLESSGVKITWQASNTLLIDPSTLNEAKVSLPDSRTNRIPILLLSVLLNRLGKAVVPIVGGDEIGLRNVDFHIKAIHKFGANVELVGDAYVAEAKSKLVGCHINLPYPSVGATETCLFLSVLAKGTSVIRNIAIEPEIMALITMLRAMGAIIFLDSNRTLTVQGVTSLTGTNIHVLGDRIEAASWAALACASDGKIEVSGVRPDQLGNFLSYYTKIGGGYDLINADTIKFYRKHHQLQSTVIETDVYPGFSTDWQQTFATLLTQAHGISVIHETVYEQRFGYLEVLNKLGAKTQTVETCLGSLPCRYKGFNHKHSALIYGSTALKAIDESIAVPDIRGGLAYLIAAALAEGVTTLTEAQQIERGYGDLTYKLKDVNLDIKRIV